MKENELTRSRIRITPAGILTKTTAECQQIAPSNHSNDPGGRLFLANVVLPYGATATANVDLVGNGQYLAHLSTTFATGIVPEPATLTLLVAMSATGLLVMRRRSS